MQVDTVWVRHGESMWNRAGLMQGQTRWPSLTRRGVRQAYAAAEGVRRYAPSRLVSSDLVRASESARIIGARLGLSVAYTPLLRERSWGVFEGMPAVEGHRADLLIPPDQTVPQGESRDDVAERLCRFLPTLTSTEGPIVVLTHGDVLREAVRLWGSDGQDEDRHANGCIIRMSIDLAAPRPRTRDGTSQ